MEIQTIIDIIKDDYIILIIMILSIIYGLYQRIKFLCLKKASEFVADVEQLECTGDEKFNIVLKWINKELPRIFRNNLFRSMIEQLIQFAYDTSFKYMKQHVQSETGKDISEIIDKLHDVIKENVEENKK